MPHDKSLRPSILSARITWMAVGLFILLLAIVVTLGSWAASRIDSRALANQAHLIQAGYSELQDAIPKEQATDAVWDDSVVHARDNDQVWLGENLVEWTSEFFGHSRVFLLDPSNQLVRASVGGVLAEAARYDEERAAIEPLVMNLRDQMRTASSGMDDSTEAISGMGTIDTVVMPDGTPAIVSVIPVVPGTAEVVQAPGTEFLLVSVKNIDATVSTKLAERFGIQDLIFSTSATTSDRASLPILGSSGRIAGFFSWDAERPAWELIASAGPYAIAGLVLTFSMGALLLFNLRQTSTKLEKSEAHSQYLAFHDSLTGIPNRALFEDRLERALAAMRRTNGKIALHYLDLDRFKHVNDTLGHPAGDELIRAVAKRLSSTIRESDTIARLGGDEFAVIQTDVENDVDVERLCERMLAELSTPFDLSGDEARVGVSVGVVLTGDTEATPTDLMRQADIALYKAKADGRGRYQLFAGEMDDAVRDNRLLERDLRAALSGGTGLSLAYQPIFDAQSGAMLGAEALVRWAHPTRGALRPDEFIGLAEDRGLIEPLGSWVMRAACTFAAGSAIPWVAVNVSPVQFRDENFADRVFAILRESGLHPRRLEIEITEGLLLQDSPSVQATLHKLRAGGVRVALDDFGTGYSSISYLRHYGVDKLKIDRSFVDQLGKGTDIDDIVLSIIQLARAMNMKVTAEGVETQAQRDILIAMNCEQLQGYLLSKPTSEMRLLAMLPIPRRAAS